MFTILAHELIHADAYMKGTAIPKLWHYQSPFRYIEHTPGGRFVNKRAYAPYEEIRALHLENIIRAEHGLWLRGLFQ